MKKIFGIISNILSFVFVLPFSLFFFGLGLLLFTFDNSLSSIVNIVVLIAMALFIISPVLCILGIIMSIVFRAKGKYLHSYLIQLMPFASIISGIFLALVTMFWGPLYQ